MKTAAKISPNEARRRAPAPTMEFHNAATHGLKIVAAASAIKTKSKSLR